MQQDQGHVLIDVIADFIGLVGRVLPDDVMKRLVELRQQETGVLASAIYDSMFTNLERAAWLNRPCCQDTGLIQFFLRAGSDFPKLADLNQILIDAVKQATIQVPLRHNAVEIFEEVNTGNNVGCRAPWVEWEIVPYSSVVEIDVYMAGGGCSLPGRAQVLMPSAGYEGIVQFVFDTVVDWGINACPPLLVGVGIGTCVSSAAKLSKKALMRPLGSRHFHPRGAMMEEEIEAGLNALGLGPQGLTGNKSVLGVHIESAARHPSALGVGVSIGCWAHRRGTIRIHEDMSYEVLSYKGA